MHDYDTNGVTLDFNGVPLTDAHYRKAMGQWWRLAEFSVLTGHDSGVDDYTVYVFTGETKGTYRVLSTYMATQRMRRMTYLATVTGTYLDVLHATVAYVREVSVDFENPHDAA